MTLPPPAGTGTLHKEPIDIDHPHPTAAGEVTIPETPPGAGPWTYWCRAQVVGSEIRLTLGAPRRVGANVNVEQMLGERQ